MYEPGGNVLAKVNGISSRSTSSQLRFATNDRPMIDESPPANYRVRLRKDLFAYATLLLLRHDYVMKSIAKRVTARCTRSVVNPGSTARDVYKLHPTLFICKFFD